MDGMKPGLRMYKSASLRVAVSQALPVEMRECTREIQSVESQVPGRGQATALMWKACVEADRAWLTLILMPEAGLREFYSRFGFSVIQEKPCLMARDPRRTT